MPDLGFLFPVFNDRSTDIHGLLYYSKNAEQLRTAFVDELFGCAAPLSAGGQRDSFNALVEETLGEDCAYDTVMNIHEKLNEWVESQKDSPEPAVLTKPEVKRLFEECGVEEEKLETFDACYEATAGEDTALMASNITNTRRMEIKTPDVVIHVDPDRAELVETRVIDGRRCLVIPMEDNVEINGIRVTAESERNSNPHADESASDLPEDFDAGQNMGDRPDCRVFAAQFHMSALELQNLLTTIMIPTIIFHGNYISRQQKAAGKRFRPAEGIILSGVFRRKRDCSRMALWRIP